MKNKIELFLDNINKYYYIIYEGEFSGGEYEIDNPYTMNIIFKNDSEEEYENACDIFDKNERIHNFNNDSCISILFHAISQAEDIVHELKNINRESYSIEIIKLSDCFKKLKITKYDEYVHERLSHFCYNKHIFEYILKEIGVLLKEMNVENVQIYEFHAGIKAENSDFIVFFETLEGFINYLKVFDKKTLNMHVWRIE